MGLLFYVKKRDGWWWCGRHSAIRARTLISTLCSSSEAALKIHLYGWSFTRSHWRESWVREMSTPICVWAKTQTSTLSTAVIISRHDYYWYYTKRWCLAVKIACCSAGPTQTFKWFCIMIISTLGGTKGKKSSNILLSRLYLSMHFYTFLCSPLDMTAMRRHRPDCFIYI